jgi:hypothetical protein
MRLGDIDPREVTPFVMEGLTALTQTADLNTSIVSVTSFGAPKDQ